MNVDLEALCKIDLMATGESLSELGEILDGWAEDAENEQCMNCQIYGNLSKEEAREEAKIYRCGIMEGYLTVFKVFRRLISNELRKEWNEFRDETQLICPVCKYGLYGNSEYIPVYDALCHMSYECFKCGYKHEFPKAMLVRDIYTEYANKKKEAEQ